MTVKGIAMGLKLGSINDTDVLGWPRNFVEMQLQTTKQLPATCSFFSCEHTQQVIDETVEHCVGKTAVVTGAGSQRAGAGGVENVGCRGGKRRAYR